MTNRRGKTRRLLLNHSLNDDITSSHECLRSTETAVSSLGVRRCTGGNSLSRTKTYHPLRDGDIVLEYRNLNLGIWNLQVGGHSKKFRERGGLHLPHQITAMHFHCNLAGSDLGGHFLVGSAGDNQG